MRALLLSIDLSVIHLDRLNRQIAEELSYRIREEPGGQSPAETLTLGRGSRRDFAALFMEACRYLGLACRFVSGYLNTSDTDVGNASTHAWAEVYLPGAGWKGFDPKNGEVISSLHISTAVACHPESVSPVAGGYLGTPDQTLSLSVTVRVRSLAL